MATIAIGDIHGNLRALSDLLDQLRSEVAGGDTVVMLGDYIDRGPDSKGCIDAILAFAGQVPATVVALCGNHEDWMLQTMGDYTRHSWLLGMQPLDTIQSYSPEAARAVRKAAREAGLRLHTGSYQLPYHLFFEALPPAHRAFFAGLRPCFQSEDCICVHAGVHPGLAATAPHEHPRNSLVWGARDFPEAVRRRGHGRLRTPQQRGYRRERLAASEGPRRNRRDRYHRAWCADRHAFPGPPRVPERQVLGELDRSRGG